MTVEPERCEPVRGVAADTNVCDICVEHVCRNPLSASGIANQWVRLLRGNHVESDVAAECYQHSTATARFPTYRKGGPLSISMPGDSSSSNALPDRPIFVDNPAEWQAHILSFGQPKLPVVSARAHAVSIAVFRAAAVWSQMFWSPLEFQTLTWAQLFDRPDMEWLTIDLAERAVNAFFRQTITGYMLPAHVINGAAIIKLEMGDG